MLVIGASGELGGALARLYARAGCTLTLWGRDLTRLAAISAACQQEGSQATTHSIDLADLDAALCAIREQDQLAPFDLCIVASGLGDIREGARTFESPELVARVMTVNLTAPAALAAELAERMAARGRGRIVLVGSAASFHALPFAAAYSASKAGLARFAQALHIAMQPHGVAVTLVSPGFIDTGAARRVPGPKPLVLTADDAARHIVRAVAAARAHAIVPRAFAVLRILDRIMPMWLRGCLLRSLAPPENL